MTRRSLRSAFVLLSLILAARGAAAQPLPGSPPPAVGGPAIRMGVPSAPAEAFGPGTQTTIIPPAAFSPQSSGYQYFNTYGDSITPTVNGEQRWYANLNLPSGAVVDTLDVFVVDNDMGSDITVYALGDPFPVTGPGTCGAGALSSATSAGVTGQGHVVISQPWQNIVMTGFVNCNGVASYEAFEIAVYLETTSHSLGGARVVWHRVVSSPPVTATFGDVPTNHPFFQFVEALVASGITAGCQASPPLYCPDAPLTRKQMAAFLAKALGLYWPQ